MNDQKYFATKDFEDLAKHCLGMVDSWQSAVGSYGTGISSIWYRNLRAYYSNIFAGNAGDSSLDYMGAEGEIIRMLVPQARSLNTQFLSLTTKQKLSFDPEAQSTDARTLVDTRVASALIEQVVRREHVDTQAYKMAEMASVVGLGYMMPSWDMMKGRKRVGDPQSGKILYTGDCDIWCPNIFQVIYDYTQEDFYKLPWVIVKRPRNRWDLIAQHPDLEEYLLKLTPITQAYDSTGLWAFNSTEDMVWEYHFIHRSSPALTDGRYAVFCCDKTMLYDDYNPYKNDDGDAYVPLVQMKPEPITGCGFGYPFFSNILPLQEMLDHSFSAAASNQAAHAIQSVLNPSGNDISVVNIGGLRFMNYKPMNLPGGGKPEALQLTATSPETFKFADMIRSYMMEIYNINGALRGSPPPGVTSGVAIATLATNALEFSQNFSKAYFEALETAMTYALWNYRSFADEPMVVSLTGPSDATYAKEFVGSDLSAIKRVKVNIGNPLMSTAAGKFEVANNLLQQGMLSTPKKYFQLLEGAPIKTLIGVDYDQEAFINQENDDLRDGKEVFVLPTDNNPQHIQSHAALLNDTEIRRNGEMVQRVMDHILEHYQAEISKDPALSQMIQTGQAPQIPPGMPPPGSPPAPGPGGVEIAPPMEEPMGAEPAESLMNPLPGGPAGVQPPTAA